MVLIAKFGLFNGILVLLLILFYSFRRTTNTIFLGLSLFFVWYSLLSLVLNITGVILEYPALLRTGLVSAYLSFPFLYIYSRNTFYPGRSWKKTDWLLLLPALISIIDFMPFYLLPADQKIAIWNENLANTNRMLLADEGWLGLKGIHFTFAYVWIAIIMYLQLRLIRRNWSHETGFKTPHNRRLLYFIVIITLLYVPLVFPGIFGVLFKLSWFNAPFIAFTYGISMTAVSIYLLVYPNILYGFLPEKRFSFPKNGPIIQPLPLQNELSNQIKVEELMQPSSEETLIAGNETAISVGDPDKMPADKEEIEAEIAIVLKLMNEQKPFRKQGFTIQDLSNQTEIPVYQLSPLINGYFKMNFANWINRYRVEYFVEQALDKQHMTLEALSREAGFISRSTFINAFKKEKGLTPKEYLKTLKISV